MKSQTLLNLPTATLNILAVGVSMFMICSGIKVLKAPDLALSVANTRLVTSNSADRLEQLAIELEEQALIIEQKDRAVEDLKRTLEKQGRSRKNDRELKQKIKAIKELPQVEDIDNIKVEIQKTEEDLLEVVTE